MITERLAEPVLIKDLHQSHPDLIWRDKIQAVDGAVLAVYEDSNNRHNLIKRDQEGKIINKLYVTDKYKYITGLIWEDPDLYVILSGGDIVHVRDGHVIKQYHIKNGIGPLYGGALDNDNILIVDYTGRTVISCNVQTGDQDIKLKGLQGPTSLTKKFYNNQLLYLITESQGRVSIYDSSWTKQTIIGSG